MSILSLRSLLLASVLAGAASCVWADQIVAVKAPKLEVFAKPDDDKPLSVVQPTGLPWQIKEERNAYFKIQLHGKEVWVDAMQVTVLRDSADKCPPKAPVQAAAEVVATSPGAGAARCR